ncbi:SusC/RagA family TonB-linked outer membrane protein [Paraflavisolibacter sp. H34]|uniref:SusC/RagA family TonB-linked outer membrane protein n=1 Tax=Huijunlia imazamoxiresistens TaxID=3127457 RepID=UPI0030163C0D
MKQLLLAVGVSLIISVPTLATPRSDSDPAFLREYFKNDPISGKVTNDKGEPLAGVTVQVKGLSTSAVTNAEGAFSINVPTGASTLVFSFVGMERKEVSIAGKSTFQIQLKSAETTLTDVVVVGYGSQKKSDVTGSVVAVDPKKLEDMPVRTLTEALAGQVPGLNVSGGNSRPGVNASLSIRQTFGWGKDASSPNPLIVIDDVIQVDPSTGLPSMEQFNLLDPTEVESITVLRDGTAAIYGSRAAQGAIIVKTKKGKTGPPKISYSGKFEYNDAVGHVKTMNAYEYGVFANRFGRAAGWQKEQFFSDAELDTMKTLNYDWRKEAWKPAGGMQHSLNVSGGSDRATYFAGATYFTQSANLGEQDYNRWTFRTGTDVKVANNLKLSATLSANNFTLEKSFTKLTGINDGSYGKQSEQNDYLILSHMPQYIPWTTTVNGVQQFVSPALAPNRALTTPAGQNNMAGWNYFAMLNNGSKTSSENFSYNTNFSLQYDVPFVKGLSLKGTYGLNYMLENSDQVSMPQMLALALTNNQAGKHLYGTGSNYIVAENKQGARVSYSDAVGKSEQMNFFATYDKTIGLHSISALASVERAEQDWQKKYVIYDNPLANAYNGASTTAGTLNTSNSYVSRMEGGTLSYLGRINYNYNSKYLLSFLLRSDASTKFAPENYWGTFPSLSAGWVISKENFFRDNVRFVDNLKLRASVGLTGNDNVKPWRWTQMYSYAADKGLGFGANGGTLVAGVTPDPAPNRAATWDKSLKRTFGIDASFLKNRLSLSVDHYRDNISNILTPMAGMIGMPISVGGAFSEQNFSAVKAWGTELSANWKDRVGQVDYSIGMNFGTGNNKVTKYFELPFNFPSANLRMEGQSSSIYPYWGFETWKNTSAGDGMLRTDADIDSYWAYLTDLATKAGTTPSFLGITNKNSLKKGMLVYQDKGGPLNAANKTIGGQNGRIEKTGEDYVQLLKENRSYGANTNLSVSWKGITVNAQIATSWGGWNSLDYIKQGTSSSNMFWSHEVFMNDMYDSTDNPNGKYPNLYYFDQNGTPSDFWKVSSFRSYVRSMTVGYSLPKDLSRRLHTEGVRFSLSGFNLWDFYNPYPKKYRSMYDAPDVDYPTLRTWALGVNVTF